MDRPERWQPDVKRSGEGEIPTDGTSHVDLHVWSRAMSNDDIARPNTNLSPWAIEQHTAIDDPSKNPSLTTSLSPIPMYAAVPTNNTLH